MAPAGRQENFRSPCWLAHHSLLHRTAYTALINLPLLHAHRRERMGDRALAVLTPHADHVNTQDEPPTLARDRRKRLLGAVDAAGAGQPGDRDGDLRQPVPAGCCPIVGTRSAVIFLTPSGSSPVALGTRLCLFYE
jgi:hypothetical protein